MPIDVNTGDIAWRVPLGIFEELDKKGIKTGTASLGGAISREELKSFLAANKFVIKQIHSRKR
jgi:quinoprotein glucose dehydrogenase